MSEASTQGAGEPVLPKEDPEHLALRAPPRPVVRLNRRNLVIFAGLFGFMILGATWWALQPKAARTPNAPAEPPRVERVPRAEGLAALPRDYGSLPTAPTLGPPVGELGRPVVRAEQAAGLEVGSSAGESYWPDPVDNAERSARLQQHDEEAAAAKAKVFFQLAQRQSETAEPAVRGRAGSSTPVASPEDKESRARQPIGGQADVNGQQDKQAFLQKRGDTKTYASGPLEEPVSPYQVMAGTVIPAALVTGINSDLPGQIIATVTSNVYDTVSGECLLIPQGSRLLGQYDSQVTAGQRRVLLVWTRLLMPDGSSMVLDRLPGVDLEGYAGLEDGVDWHWKRIFTGAALATLIGINAELASPNRSGDSGSVIVATRDSAQETVNQIGQQLTRRNLNQQPTLTIRPGFPVRVIVNRDLVLRPYEPPIKSVNPS